LDILDKMHTRALAAFGIAVLRSPLSSIEKKYILSLVALLIGCTEGALKQHMDKIMKQEFPTLKGSVIPPNSKIILRRNISLCC
jgi:hypothetical protein